MKSKITIGAVKINVPGAVAGIEENIVVEFGGAEVDVDYSLTEITGLYDLQKTAMKEVPGLINNFIEEIAINTYNLYKKINAIEEVEEESLEV